MTFPALTATYSALLGLLFAALSAWVIAGRFRYRILIGDGGEKDFSRRMRAHGNFAEYVPLILLLAGFLESSGASRTTIHALLGALLVARLMHPIGMEARAGSLQQYLFRGLPMITTLLILTATALLLLFRTV